MKEILPLTRCKTCAIGNKPKAIKPVHVSQTTQTPLTCQHLCRVCGLPPHAPVHQRWSTPLKENQPEPDGSYRIDSSNENQEEDAYLAPSNQNQFVVEAEVHNASYSPNSETATLPIRDNLQRLSDGSNDPFNATPIRTGHLETAV